MSNKKKTAKKSTKKAKDAAAPAPTVEETQVPATEAQEQAPQEPQLPEVSQDAAAPAPTATDTVMVLVGPNSPAGRIMLGRTIYDGITPQWMSRANFERLKAKYDLREVKAE